jgi:hypothetical protein
MLQSFVRQIGMQFSILLAEMHLNCLSKTPLDVVFKQFNK